MRREKYCPPELNIEILTFCRVIANSPTTIGGGSEGMSIIDPDGSAFEKVDNTDNVEW